MFQRFEDLIQPTEMSAAAAPPTRDEARGLLRFYWHYARQVRGLIVALFLAGMVVAAFDAMIPVIIGRIVSLISRHDPATLLRDAWPQLVGMAAFLLVMRPGALLTQNLITNQAIAAGLTNLVR
ncbi:MAG: multidrug ABC transporter ATP-binding protein, partial [Acidisphaera sp.]|nr:multidrug ABC transporter ATP-binding protein [Acidisphaera sp.]